jgi:hypothetical protein
LLTRLIHQQGNIFKKAYKYWRTRHDSNV